MSEGTWSDTEQSALLNLDTELRERGSRSAAAVLASWREFWLRVLPEQRIDELFAEVRRASRAAGDDLGLSEAMEASAEPAAAYEAVDGHA